MTRVVLPLCFAALLGLTACSSDPNRMASSSSQPAASPASAATTAYRAGNGVVQSVTPAPRIASAGATSAPATTTRSEPVTAAGSAGSTAAAMQRLAIRMDDGRVQYVDMASGQDIPPVGSRVQLTPDYKIIRQP